MKISELITNTDLIQEALFQEKVHNNPSISTLKSLARNNKFHSARFVIYKDGNIVAADSERYTHHTMAPAMGAWDVRGFVVYQGDNSYAYRSMEPMSGLTKDHPILRVWERQGIENGNPDAKENISNTLDEKWSKKYKKSINCNNPKGFSQRAHCAGRRARRAGKDTKSQSVRESLSNPADISKSFLSSPEGKQNEHNDCKTVTRAFVKWAKSNNIPVQVLSLAPPSKETLERRLDLYNKDGQGAGHIMPVVAGHAIDFTARQFPKVNHTYSNPLITPLSKVKQTYRQIGGYFTDAPKWFIGGKTHYLGPWESIPISIMKQDFPDERLKEDHTNTHIFATKKTLDGQSKSQHLSTKSKNLNEGKSTPVIVVDVQPEYSGMNDGDENPVFPNIINFVNNQTGLVLMYVNAEDTGLTGDSVVDVKRYWEDTVREYLGKDEDELPDPIDWSRFTIVDKGYGYLRSWMNSNIPPKTIIKTIRLMYQQKVSDSRELHIQNDMTEIQDAINQMEDDPIYVNWINVAQLKRFSGAYIVGGGRDQCLREVELLMNAFNIKYKRINSLVY